MNNEEKNLNVLLDEFIPKVTYNKDLQEFGEWIVQQPYEQRYKGLWIELPLTTESNFKTTSDLQIDWEIETGRRPKP